MEKLEPKYSSKSHQSNDFLCPKKDQIPEADKQTFQISQTRWSMEREKVLPLHEKNKRISNSLCELECYFEIFRNPWAQMLALQIRRAAFLHANMQNIDHEVPLERCHFNLTYFKQDELGQKDDTPHC